MERTVDDLVLRPPTWDDYDYFIGRLDQWWDGRSMAAMLPRLFFTHFPQTSIVATERSTGARAGFLCGLWSQADDTVAYIHFVGVDPDKRRSGLGGVLYRWCFDRAAAQGRSVVRCVTSPVNARSIGFHRAMGFEGASVPDYDGPGEDRVLFARALA